jgi:hypothetical protein
LVKNLIELRISSLRNRARGAWSSTWAIRSSIAAKAGLLALPIKGFYFNDHLFYKAYYNRQIYPTTTREPNQLTFLQA